jgi:tetratricopeptide (TPR) repeat protein
MHATLYGGLAVSRRARLHRAAANAMERFFGPNVALHAPTLAHHYRRAGSVEAERAARFTVMAAEAAEALRDWDTAVTQRAATFRLGRAIAEEERCRLLLPLARAHARAGNREAADQAYLETAALARAHRLTAELCQAALAYGGAGYVRGDWDPATMERLLTDARHMAGDTDTSVRPRLQAREAYLAEGAMAPEQRDLVITDAVIAARSTGDAIARMATLQILCRTLAVPDHCSRLVETANELIALADSEDQEEYALLGRRERIRALVSLGDMSAAMRDIRQVAALADALRQPYYRAIASCLLASSALFDGRFDEAERLTRDAVALGERSQPAEIARLARLHNQWLALSRGQVAAFEAAIAPLRGDSATQHLAVFGYAELGISPDRAVLPWPPAPAGPWAPEGAPWFTTCVQLADGCAAAGSPEQARILYDTLLPHASSNAVDGVGCTWMGSTERVLGLLAARLERWDTAWAHFERALSANARMGARPWLCRTHLGYARARALGHARQCPLTRTCDCPARAAAQADAAAGLAQ